MFCYNYLCMLLILTILSFSSFQECIDTNKSVTQALSGLVQWHEFHPITQYVLHYSQCLINLILLHYSLISYYWCRVFHSFRTKFIPHNLLRRDNSNLQRSYLPNTLVPSKMSLTAHFENDDSKMGFYFDPVTTRPNVTIRPKITTCLTTLLYQQRRSLPLI